MFNFRKQTVATGMCSLAALALAGAEVRAQSFRPALPGNALQNPLTQSFRPALPGNALQNPPNNGFFFPGGPIYGQYLNNIGAYGQALNAQSALSPYSNAYGNGSSYANGSSYGSNYYEDPYAGFLRGSADVINAQGKYVVLEQQAVLVREQTNSQRLANRRKLFDAYLYERDKTPTLQDERERTQAQELRRSLTNPPVTEIWSAKALNDLLNELQKQAAKDVLGFSGGSQKPLDQDLLKLVNVTSATRGGNLGPFKNGGRLNWPLAVSGSEFKEARERLASLAQDAVKEAEFNGRVDAGGLKQMNEDLDRLERQLSRSVGDLPPSQYIEAKRFLNSLGDAVKVLGQADAASYLSRKHAAKGQTVPDLVKYMTENGLQFAPAVAGDEAAYVALHRALAAYAHGPDSEKR